MSLFATKYYLSFLSERRHVYNFKNDEGFLKFKAITSANGRFSNIFNNENGLSFAKQIKIWQKRLKVAVKSCFLKVRIRVKKNKSCHIFKRRKRAIKRKEDGSKQKAEHDLEEEEARLNFLKVKSNLEELENPLNGRQTNIWNIKKKFFPKK